MKDGLQEQQSKAVKDEINTLLVAWKIQTSELNLSSGDSAWSCKGRTLGMETGIDAT